MWERCALSSVGNKWPILRSENQHTNAGNKCDLWWSFLHRSSMRPGTPSYGREDAEEVENRGRVWWWEGENEWEGHSETERSHHNKTSPTTKQQGLQTGLSAFLTAWPLSKCKNNLFSVKFWWRRQRVVSAWKDGRFNKDQIAQENTTISFYPASLNYITSW